MNQMTLQERFEEVCKKETPKRKMRMQKKVLERGENF